MRILFKCDQSNLIGLGHYYRCVALAKIFKQNNHNCFFLGLKPGITKTNKISLINQKKDLDYTLKFIKKNKIKILIKDIYSLGLNWEKKISKKVLLVVIDDFNNIKHHCHVYINYHLNWFKKKDFRYLTYNKCKKLIGPKFTIIRDLKFKKKIKNKIKTIFIYMGGSDKKLLMMKLVRLFMNKKFDNFKKIFLLNKNHLKKTYILKTLKNMPNTKVLKHKIKNFHKNIIDSDLSISPAGITMLELMALNSNNLIIPQNKTQKKIANILKKASAINFANNISTINFKIILNLINKKKKNIKIINKMGKKIVFKEIISQLKNFYA